MSLDLKFRGDVDALITQQMTDEADIVADAVGSLTSLEKLALSDAEGQYFIVPIITCLVDHPNLLQLSLDQSIGDGRDNAVRFGRAIQNVLLSSTPLDPLCFNLNDDIPHEDGFDHIPVRHRELSSAL